MRADIRRRELLEKFYTLLILNGYASVWLMQESSPVRQDINKWLERELKKLSEEARFDGSADQAGKGFILSCSIGFVSAIVTMLFIYIVYSVFKS